MIADTNDEAALRRELTEALETPAKQWGGSQPYGAPSFKYLGDHHIKTAPKRLSEIVDPQFVIDVLGKSKVSMSKAVTGFAASLFKVVAFLAEKGLAPRSLMVEGAEREKLIVALVHAYWPSTGDVSFESPLVQGWIRQGILSAANAARTDRELSIQVNLVEWGPFSFKSEPSDGEIVANTFLRSYGRSLLAAVDPVSFDSTKGVFKDVSFEDALDAVPKSLPGRWQVTLGIYDSLIRRYRGYSFVTYPLRVPVAGLLLSSSSVPGGSEHSLIETVERTASTNRDGDASARAFALPEESGHLFLGRILPSSQIALLDRPRPGQPSLTADQIAGLLLDEVARDSRSIVFVSDTVLCAQVHKRLLTRSAGQGTAVCPLQQPPGDRAEFSFRTGIMLRDEDKKLHDLFGAAQQELLRSTWQSEQLFKRLLADGVGWLKAEGLDWPGPLFALDREGLTELAPTAKRQKRLLAIAAEYADIIDVGELT